MVTAVEWLYEQMLLSKKSIMQYQNIFEQAKKMEKQQIIDAKDCWFENEMDGEQYYNETFKNK